MRLGPVPMSDERAMPLFGSAVPPRLLTGGRTGWQWRRLERFAAARASHRRPPLAPPRRSRASSQPRRDCSWLARRGFGARDCSRPAKMARTISSAFRARRRRRGPPGPGESVQTDAGDRACLPRVLQVRQQHPYRARRPLHWLLDSPADAHHPPAVSRCHPLGAGRWPLHRGDRSAAS